MTPNNTDIDNQHAATDPGAVSAASVDDNPDIDPELHAEASELLLALDRLMTVGTYYQQGHDRHQAVSDNCLETVRRSLATRATLDVEATSDGLRVFGQHFPSSCREARRLFSLMDPLCLGVLSIKPGVTVQQLQDGLTVLKTRRNNISASTSYEEVQINGMPENVEALGRTLYLRTRTGGGGSLRSGGSFEPNLITPEMLAAGADLHKSETEFLKIINDLVKTMSGKCRHEDDDNTGTSSAAFDLDKGLPEPALLAIKDIIQSLVGTQSDPFVFNHLIAHAQAALEVTGDPETVQLVFEKLRKETGGDHAPRAKLIGKTAAQKRRNRLAKHTMSPDELREAIENIIEPYGPMENPESLDRAMAMGVCLHMLRSAPNPDLVRGIHGTLRRIFGAPHFSGPERRATAKLVVEIFSGPSFKRNKSHFRLIWDMLREYRPKDVGPVWLEVWRTLPPKFRYRAWPYTVNDILLGMTWNNPVEALSLYGLVSRVRVSGHNKLRYALENQEALQNGELSDDIFWPPPPLLFPVLHLLIGSSLSPVLGPLLHDHLLRLQTHPLAVVMLEAATEYHPGNRVVYQAILEQGVREKLTERMVELGGRLLSLALLRLPPGERKEAWIPDAISWLGKLAPENVTEVLGRIVSEKKLLMIPAWPKDLRAAAEAAWLALGEDKPDDAGPDQVGAFAVEDEEADIFSPLPASDVQEVAP